LRISHQEPDKNHPWGHGRFETVGTVPLGVILIAVGATLAYEMLVRAFNTTEIVVPSWPALVVAALSVVSKEAIFRYSLKIGKELKSDLLIANAWHSRTDALSSIIVFVALIGAMLGVWWLDALAAVLVALFIGKIGWGLVTSSITELVDTALPPERVKELRETVLEVEGILSAHDFKSRTMGNQVLLEMHLQVAPHLSASEGHYVGDLAVYALQNRFDDLSHIIFHIDTYDDQPFHDQPMPVMPSRKEIKVLIYQQMDQLIGSHENFQLTLYYDPSYVDIELKLQAEFMAELDKAALSLPAFRTQLEQELGRTGWFRNLTIWLPEPQIRP
ncbi:MAG: cation transporter, partial [Oceanospirillaceae bacterium]|nr:cation transporter [Oceanospirillaceae bacterium]